MEGVAAGASLSRAHPTRTEPFAAEAACRAKCSDRERAPGGSFAGLGVAAHRAWHTAFFLGYAGRMLQRRAARLFRGVVLAGSALGCGARVDEPAEENAARSPAASEPRSDEPAQWPPSAAATTAATNTPAPVTGAPSVPAAGPDVLIPPPPPDCQANQQPRCTAQGSSAALACTCEAIVPRSAADCARPEQFQCADAGAGACSCDAPGVEPGCPGLQRWYCAGYAPQSPCRCLEIRIR